MGILKMAARVTYRRKHTYRSRSNQVRKFRTPGGKLSVQYTTKRNGLRVCAETGNALQGIKRLRNTEFSKLSKRQRTVSRPYGGCLSMEACRHTIMRAFFNEEMKIIKQGATAMRRNKRKGGKRRN